MDHDQTQENAIVSITSYATSYAQFVPLFAARIKALEEINKRLGNDLGDDQESTTPVLKH